LPGGWWHETPESGRVICDLCPRACNLKPGDRGFCFVRQNVDGEMVLTTFGRSTGFCIDPIEKKPLNHFYPGTSVLSFGTAGCNLGCKFCQNWDISKSREIERLSELATPESIAEAARQLDCLSVAFTYNDPVIWAEYAIETAKACRERGLKAVAVTAGYITPVARGTFYEFMDAANVDLKGFTEEFYHKITYSHLQPVLDTLEWLKKETDVWFEITNLVIPQANDSMDEISQMSGWILEHCGDDVPVHFTAFHPDWRMRDRGPTPPATLLDAQAVARREGLKYVYVGNVNDVEHQSTYCAHCGKLLIERNWYELGRYRLRGSFCGHCGGKVVGRFGDRPGKWGRKRVPVEISAFARAEPQVVTITPPSRPMNASNSASASNPEPATSTAEAEIPSPQLTALQRAAILNAAAEVVAAAILNRPAALADPTLAGAAGFAVAGAYVTLKRRGLLRACCGTLGTPRTLLKAIRHAAQHTAREDYRLPPICAAELPYLDLDVNLLFGHEVVPARGRDRLAAVQVGRHGLRIQRGEAMGLLLPSVAVSNGWDTEAFFRHICRKAGLPTTAWEDDDATLYTFESVEFGGPFDTSALANDSPLALEPARIAAAELEQTARLARRNVQALMQGMTPDYYQYGMPDGNVSGLALTVQPLGAAPIHTTQLSLRPGVPFQATLFALCENAAGVLARMGAKAGSLRVGVTVFTDPALQGTIGQPDLRGLDPARRALLAVEQDKTSWVYDPARSAEDLLAVLRERFEYVNADRVGLFSLEANSTEDHVFFHSIPKAQVYAGTRPPAVAGRFYPDNAPALAALVEGMLSATERRAAAWPAAMVPHAGLRYSGAVAAAVFNRLAIPELVLVIGPKHTRFGVEWAVAPCEAWSIPGATLPADPALARELAAAIPGLQLDAAAHAQEHAIEVELPFLARLAPGTRVVGLAIGGGNWELCQRFARGLAEVIRRLPAPPLLLISSDMNHFASDRENRLLDELALKAMERLDPAHLLATVTEHDISMCGVLPAVIVMETLRQLGGLNTCERVAYATSADTTGDTSRVVGYAGVLLR
jgi:AmmeMemoRadiSam system radical SAM enzyme/AmmeMemoRadiSam system protein B/AmmeMemoRadiSam system protein A